MTDARREERIPAPEPRPGGGRWRVPSATAAVFLATGAVTAAQLAFPEVLEALRRDPGALASGE
ncbi:hypothetical protein [Streptomyces sp. HF10]|uniref:hypothetical protein n=1 Tax=Streptomyces sp. HF10 TaxID=2692233 RepID=UPI0019157F06|nr:hypothetical protein [Streptomyces sp. HF10]